MDSFSALCWRWCWWSCWPGQSRNSRFAWCWRWGQQTTQIPVVFAGKGVRLKNTPCARDGCGAGIPCNAGGHRQNFQPILTAKRQTRRSGRAGGVLLAYGLARSVSSRIAASSRFSSRLSALICWRRPPLKALRATFALPAALVGPVDRSHGLHVCIASACRCRRSKVHPFAIVGLLQLFDWHRFIFPVRRRDAVVDLLRALGDVGLPYVRHRVFDSCQGLSSGARLALGLECQPGQ